MAGDRQHAAAEPDGRPPRVRGAGRAAGGRDAARTPSGAARSSGARDDPLRERQLRLRLAGGPGARGRSTSRSRPGAASRSWARPAPARARCSACSRASYDPNEGRVMIDGDDVRDLDLDALRRERRARVPGELCCSARRSRTTSPSVTRTPPATRSRRAAADAPARTTSSPRCPTATTPCSRRRGATSRAGSGSGWPSRGRSWPSRRCCCSTIRPAPSTRTPSTRCWTRWSGARGAHDLLRTEPVLGAPRRRPDPGAGRRPHRRARHARRAAGRPAASTPASRRCSDAAPEPAVTVRAAPHARPRRTPAAPARLGLIRRLFGYTRPYARLRNSLAVLVVRARSSSRWSPGRSRA